MTTPTPTPIYRIMHISNLEICLERGGMYAHKHTPHDGLNWRTIHDPSIQKSRHMKQIDRGPRGVLHDYVPFYFGRLSPMMLKLKTERVTGYTEGQEPLIYLVSNVQKIDESTCGYVFTDGHALATLTETYDQISDLGKIDWRIVNERYWKYPIKDDDRQRRKQAEFLVHQFCDWEHIDKIVVMNSEMKAQVGHVIAAFPQKLHRVVEVKREWYYW